MGFAGRKIFEWFWSSGHSKIGVVSTEKSTNTSHESGQTTILARKTTAFLCISTCIMVLGWQPLKDGVVSSCSRNKILRCSNFYCPNDLVCLAKIEGGLLYHSSLLIYELLRMIPQLIDQVLRKICIICMYIYIYIYTNIQ